MTVMVAMKIRAGLTTLVYDDFDGDGYGAGLPYHQCGPARVGQSVRDGDWCDEIAQSIPTRENWMASTTTATKRSMTTHCPPILLATSKVSVLDSTNLLRAGWLACEYGGAGYESPEVSCDGLDNDCDGQTDEQLTTTVFTDADADGFGHGPPVNCGEVLSPLPLRR